MTKILAFNWKMNPGKLKTAISLARASDFKGAVIIPPFIFIEEIAKVLKKANLGAQDLSWENPPVDRGAFTGEVSATELKNLGVEYVIVGHSERRLKLNETDEMINKKVLTALKAGLKVILCIGEGLAIRKKGKKSVEKFIKSQLQKDLKGINKLLVISHKSLSHNLVIAYEPIWAIGTGRSDTPEDAVEIIKYIKQILVDSVYTLIPKVLYGGSVSGKNIKNFVKYKEIDGFLVGGASLKSIEINKIIKACLKKQKA